MAGNGRWRFVQVLAAVGERRLIFLLLSVLVVGALFLPAGGGLSVNRETQDVFDTIENLHPGDPVLISFDFEPTAKPELYPASRAILRHAFRKKLRVFVVVLWPAGKGLATQALEAEVEIARARDPDTPPDEAYPVDGTDYVFLGWQPGEDAVIVRLTEGIQGAFPKDDRGRNTEGLAVWTDGQGRRVRTLKDLALVVSISAGFPGIDEWIRLGRGKEVFPLASAVTAVTGPGKMPFYISGQIVGLLNGMRGAAEYESLVNDSEDGSSDVPPLRDAMSGLTVLSASHFLVIVLVIVSNVAYFVARKRGRA